MTPEFSANAVPVLIRALRERLQEALAKAKAAEAYLETSGGDGVLEIVLDVEMPLCEAETLLNAVAIIQRRARP